MTQGLLSGPHLLILLLIIVLLFGSTKLPGLAKSLGQSMRIFRGEMRQMQDENPKAKKDAATPSEPTIGETVTPITAEPQQKPNEPTL